MMDYMSNFPPPTRENSVIEITNFIVKIPTFKSISTDYITKEITKQFDIVTNSGKTRGSATGWSVHERPEIIQRTKTSLNMLAYKKYRFKAIIKTLAYLNKAYIETLDRYYAPGNPGMTLAYLEFEEYKNKTID